MIHITGKPQGEVLRTLGVIPIPEQPRSKNKPQGSEYLTLGLAMCTRHSS